MYRLFAVVGLFALVFSWCAASASTFECGTVREDLRTIGHPYEPGISSAVVRIFVHGLHVAGSSESIIPESQLEEVRELLSEGFEPYGIDFELVGTGSVSFASGGMVLPGGLKADHGMASVIDVFVGNEHFYDETDSWGSSGTSPSTVFVVLGADFLSPVLIHEMGHCLGLEHTYTAQANCVEGLDGTNCETCGDEVCDTALYPSGVEGIAQWTDPATCTLTQAFQNAYPGYSPDPTNYMARTHLGCLATFTPEQNARMLEHIESHEVLQPLVVVSRAVFDNRSTETGLDYAGLPYSSVGFESDHDDPAQRNLEDLMITIATGGPRSAFYRADEINGNGVPEFFDDTLDAFDSGSVPQDGLGGVSVADMDNDGDLDLFCASGTSSTPRLYRNDGDGTFTDVTSTLGLATAASNSWAGTWADYDGDGWVDLFLARGGGPGVPPEGMSAQPAYLMRNGLDPELGSGGFENVTAAVGLASGNANYAASISACWADIDNDGRLDLYLAEYSDNAGGIRGKLFVQQSDGTFQEEGASRLPTGSLFAQAAAQFVDMDLDGDLDLVTGNRVLNVGAVVYWNDGTGGFTAENPLTVPSIGGVSGLKVWDQDLDTRPDLLLTTRDPQQTARFFHNLDAGSGLVLQDETGHVGLDTGHEAGGLTVLDWNRDGDQDVYLGRQVSTQKFFYRTVAQSDGGDDLQADFICVRLSSPQGVNNRAGIGARVSVQNDGRWIHRWVDGGSGRGSQDDLTVTLPVPVSTGTHLVQIQWPNGWTQVDTATVNPIGQDPEIILDETNPMVVDASVAGTTALDAGQGQFYWVFNWETGYRSDWSLDKVTLPASPCVPAGAVYTPATAGVEHTISRLSTGNYRHVMRVPVTCSAPCQIQFTVESSHRAGISSTSAAKILRVKFCPTQL